MRVRLRVRLRLRLRLRVRVRVRVRCAVTLPPGRALHRGALGPGHVERGHLARVRLRVRVRP